MLTLSINLASCDYIINSNSSSGEIMENTQKLFSYDKRIDRIEEIDHLTGPDSVTNFKKLQTPMSIL